VTMAARRERARTVGPRLWRVGRRGGELGGQAGPARNVPRASLRGDGCLPVVVRPGSALADAVGPPVERDQRVDHNRHR